MLESLKEILRRADDVQKGWRHVVFGIICEEDCLLLKRFEEEGDDTFVNAYVGLKIADYCTEFNIVVFHTIQIKLLNYLYDNIFDRSTLDHRIIESDNQSIVLCV